MEINKHKMNLKIRIKHLCEKYGVEKVVYYLAEYFICNWREIDSFKKYIEGRIKEEEEEKQFNKTEYGKLLKKK